MGWLVRTGPARARSSRSWPASINLTAARSSSMDRRSRSLDPPTLVPLASRWFTRNRSSSRISRWPRTSSSAMPRGRRLGSTGDGWSATPVDSSNSLAWQSIPARRFVGLSMADQQLIEIARSLSLKSRILILDEPTASLSAHEVDRLFTIVSQTRSAGVAILFVSHRLEEVFELTDRTTVFRDGRHVMSASTSSLQPSDLIRLMVGREVTLFPRVDKPIGEVVLGVRGTHPARRVQRHQLHREERRDRRHGRPGRGWSDRGGASPVRDRSSGFRGGPARWQAGRIRQPSGCHGRRAGLRAGGSTPTGAGARLLDLLERHAADPAPALSASCNPSRRRTRRSRGLRAAA